MNEAEINKLRDAIKLERFRNKINQNEIAKELGISKTWYVELEKNPNKIDLEQAYIISKKLNFNIFEFIDKEILNDEK